MCFEIRVSFASSRRLSIGPTLSNFQTRTQFWTLVLVFRYEYLNFEYVKYTYIRNMYSTNNNNVQE